MDDYFKNTTKKLKIRDYNFSFEGEPLPEKRDLRKYIERRQ